MYGYGYGAPSPYGAPPPPPYGSAPPAYGAPPPAYGAPPPYGAYGAPPAPYGAQPAPYGAPPAAYGAPPAAYGAPPAAYGAQPAAYGAQPAPYGAPAPAYGAPPAAYGAPPAYGSTAPPPAAAGAPPASNSGAPTQPAAPAAQNSGYPSLNAPPPRETVPGGSSSSGSHVTPSSLQRPASAYPAMGAASAHASAGPAPATDALFRPSSAGPSGAHAYAYGAPAAQPPPNPQQPMTAFTYGQPPHAAPQAAAAPSYMPPTTYTPAPGHGGRRRRALLIGCAYPGSSAALNGCLNDVQCIQYCLQNRFGFTEQQFLVLRDDPGRHRDFTSTKANIYRGIQWLMTGQQPGDSLFFHFSGHGSQQYDRNGDEEDGYDETICPTDFRSAGQIVDDELNRMLVRPLMTGVTLHAVVDACHSGTALDLPFRAKVDSSGRCYWKGRGRYDKATMGGTVFQFGACKDSQVAQDTKALSGKAYTGAATFCFIQAIEKNGTQQTYGQLLGHMMSALRAATGSPGMKMGSTTSLIASFLLGSGASSLLGGGGQTPVLSCDKQVDLYAARLSL